MTDKKYFTVKEVSTIFRRHPATIRKWVAEGKLYALKIKHGLFIPVGEVEKLGKKEVIECQNREIM